MSQNTTLLLSASFKLRGGHWGLRYCGNGQLFMRYFGTSDLKLRHCDILKNLRDSVFSVLLGI